VLDVTWLQDANYAATSGHDADGRMTWDAASAWAAGLSYGGYTDWRLATVADTGTPGCDYAYTGTDCGYNVQTTSGGTVYSEMASLWYDTLRNTAWYDTSGNPTGCSSSDPWCLTSTGADGVNFLNLQSDFYWSGTEYAPYTYDAWGFNTNHGNQIYSHKSVVFYAWAVRSGDVSAVPVPAAVWLFGTGLIGLLGVARRKR